MDMEFEKPKSICANCQHIRYRGGCDFYDRVCFVYGKINPITGKKEFRRCENCNGGGDCPKYVLKIKKKGFLKRLCSILLVQEENSV